MTRNTGTYILVGLGVGAFVVLAFITFRSRPEPHATPAELADISSSQETAPKATHLIVKRLTPVTMVNPEPIISGGIVFTYGRYCNLGYGDSLTIKGEGEGQTLLETSIDFYFSGRCPPGALFFVQTRDIPEITFTPEEYDRRKQEEAVKEADTKNRVRKILGQE